jgi:hypothetical protein
MMILGIILVLSIIHVGTSRFGRVDAWGLFIRGSSCDLVRFGFVGKFFDLPFCVLVSRTFRLCIRLWRVFLNYIDVLVMGAFP